jgi:protein arginine kinase
MNLDDLLPQLCPWLRSENKECDIVVSSRIRLARNLAGFPFPVRATEQDRRLIQNTVKKAAEELFSESEFHFADIPSLSPLEREYLLERQLISRKIAESERSHAVLIDRQERFCVMINDDDHIKIHATDGGLVPQKVWSQIDPIDTQFGNKLDYVFHKKYGFLTSLATNAGTGMRISILVHLPALVATNEIDKVARSLLKKNLTARGLYGEQALGDLFLIGNRITLGKSEEELIARMVDLIPQIVGYERQARDFLLKNRREITLDRCSRAVGVLQTARTISNTETMRHLSSLRLGFHLGLLKNPDIATINSLLLYTQPAHLQKIQGAELSQTDLDVARATYIRQRTSNSVH